LGKESLSQDQKKRSHATIPWVEGEGVVARKNFGLPLSENPGGAKGAGDSAARKKAGDRKELECNAPTFGGEVVGARRRGSAMINQRRRGFREPDDLKE